MVRRFRSNKGYLSKITEISWGRVLDYLCMFGKLYFSEQSYPRYTRYPNYATATLLLCFPIK